MRQKGQARGERPPAALGVLAFLGILLQSARLDACKCGRWLSCVRGVFSGTYMPVV